MPALMLIDGNSLTYRAFFALPADMATASGQVTNAVFGFTSMLINLLRDHRPSGIVVAFDRPEPTFRHEQLDSYKANRQAAPDILRQQMGLVRQVIETLAIPIVELPGFEADDIIATLATKAAQDGMDVLVVTGDRDSYQLVSDPHIKVLYNRRGVSDYALYDEAGILERTGVPPSLYVEYAALRGDPSDNLPGVPGVGEKTAAKLISTYGGLDGTFANLASQTPKLRENLAANEGLARLNAQIMLLRRDVPIGMDLASMHQGEIDAPELKRLFDFLEFRTLHERLLEALGPPPAPKPTSRQTLDPLLRIVESAGEAIAALAALATMVGPLGVAGCWEGTAERGPLEGIALVADVASTEVVWLPASLLRDVEVREHLKVLLGGGRSVVGHSVKPLLRALLECDVRVEGLTLDTGIGAYLLEPSESHYLLSELLPRFTPFELADESPTVKGQLDFAASGPTAMAKRAAGVALGAALLAEPMQAELSLQGLRALNDEIEVPLVGVLAAMEHVGVAVDREELERLNRDLGQEAGELTRSIWADAGREFNVNSTLQLRQVLYDELGLAPQKKTKTGFSTNAATLEKLAGEHPIVDHLLRYREVEKLRSTYGDGLLTEVAADGRIHATFNQTVARTGRLSSEEPNLHNIPVRSELGRSFRRAFVATAGTQLLIADYNQIELRCIAHLALDPGLIRAFEERQDIHTATAARVFGVEPANVSLEMRSKAKMISYGLAYGMEAYGLGQRLNIPTDEAAHILDAYFVAFPAVKDYMDRAVIEARKKGYTETLYGRRRYIPELLSSNFRIRQAGERQAMNAGIQGLAADIFKVALVRLAAALSNRDAQSRVVLQVHDEIILEMTAAETTEMTELVPAIMAGASELAVPLEVNLSVGSTWAAAKG